MKVGDGRFSYLGCRCRVLAAVPAMTYNSSKKLNAMVLIAVSREYWRLLIWRWQCGFG